MELQYTEKEKKTTKTRFFSPTEHKIKMTATRYFRFNLSSFNVTRL